MKGKTRNKRTKVVCSVCKEKRNLSSIADWSRDICGRCLKKLKAGVRL